MTTTYSRQELKPVNAAALAAASAIVEPAIKAQHVDFLANGTAMPIWTKALEADVTAAITAIVDAQLPGDDMRDRRIDTLSEKAYRQAVNYGIALTEQV